MKQSSTLVGVLIEETSTISFKEVCEQYQIPKELLLEMVEFGIFSSNTTQIEQIQFTQMDLRRIESAFRLHHDLGVNLSGVALALELLDTINQLNDELMILRKHF